jgi:hypothetical protein
MRRHVGRSYRTCTILGGLLNTKLKLLIGIVDHINEMFGGLLAKQAKVLGPSLPMMNSLTGMVKLKMCSKVRIVEESIIQWFMMKARVDD